MAKKTPALRAQVEQVFHLTDEFQVRLGVLESALVPVEVRINPSVGGASGGDVEALAFTVMMAAATSARQDLESILEAVKAINDAKEKVRAALDKKGSARPQRSGPSTLDFEAMFHLMATLYARQLTVESDALLGDLDSMSEMGEMESLRLQMAMDRLSKLMSTLSNLLKKASDTSSQIVQNLK
jgi:hypothetical protein